MARFLLFAMGLSMMGMGSYIFWRLMLLRRHFREVRKQAFDNCERILMLATTLDAHASRQTEVRQLAAELAEKAEQLASLTWSGFQRRELKEKARILRTVKTPMPVIPLTVH